MLAQMTKDEWEKNIKDVIKCWHETNRLNENPLTNLSIVSKQWQSSAYENDVYRKGKSLRDVLQRGITSLGVEGEAAPEPDSPNDPKWMQRRWRHYNILSLLPDYEQAEVASRVGLALGGQFYRDQAKALELLAEVLRLWEGSPIGEASPIPLKYPSGAVKPTDRFYVVRKADQELHRALSGPGETITIRGSRQVGKTSLLIRGMSGAQHHYGARVVYFDLQNAGSKVLNSLEEFLRTVADWIFYDLDLDLEAVEKTWNSRLPAQKKLTMLIERHVLPKIQEPVLLAMDEIDRLQLTGIHTDFFALIRSWHNMRAGKPQWDKLSTLMAISTEPYLLIDDLNQSPFNVGIVLNLQDFDASQVSDLNDRHGSPLIDEEQLQLMKLLNGHPYLTRVAFYTLVTEQLTWADIQGVATSESGPFHQHLQHQYRMIINDAALKHVLKEVVRTGRCSDDTAGFRLMKAGLVIKEGDIYKSRNELYRQYFANKL